MGAETLLKLGAEVFGRDWDDEPVDSEWASIANRWAWLAENGATQEQFEELFYALREYRSRKFPLPPEDRGRWEERERRWQAEVVD